MTVFNLIFSSDVKKVSLISLIIQLHTHEVVEVCAKILYQVELQRSTLEQMWGFSVEAELIENADRQDELCCYVSRVEDKSVALQNGETANENFLITSNFPRKFSLRNS